LPISVAETGPSSSNSCTTSARVPASAGMRDSADTPPDPRRPGPAPRAVTSVPLPWVRIGSDFTTPVRRNCSGTSSKGVLHRRCGWDGSQTRRPAAAPTRMAEGASRRCTPVPGAATPRTRRPDAVVAAARRLPSLSVTATGTGRRAYPLSGRLRRVVGLPTGESPGEAGTHIAHLHRVEQSAGDLNPEE